MSRRARTRLGAALSGAALFAPLAAQAPAPPAPPRLVVICSVDQLATWVLDQGLPHCRDDGGFRRLLREGVSFPRCAYLHGCTETGPGHATLGTGAPASVHGIVRNEWFDPATGKSVYCVGDAAAAAVPDFPEGRGRGPGLLLAPTVGELLRARHADAKVVSVSCKDRAAILMAGRTADAVVWWEAATGRFVTNATWGDAAPDWLLAFDRQHPTDAFFGWEWRRCAPDAAYADCTDDRPYEPQHISGGRTLPVAITGRKDAPERAFYDEAFYSPVANELVLRAALAALRGGQLGRDDVPDLLCVSFSGNDTVGHWFGPDSVEARDTLLRLDRLLAELLLVLDAEVGAGRYAFLLSSDHGVGPTPEAARAAGRDAGRGLLHLRAKAAAEQALDARFAAAGIRGSFVRQASEQSLYLDAALLAQAAGGGDAAAVFREACAIAAAAAAKTPAVLQAFVVRELLEGDPGDDPLRAAMRHAVHPGRCGDVVLVFKPNWVEGPVTATHGSPHAYDREVPLLAMGPGLRAGHSSGAPVSPGLVAVLASRLLGIDRPAAAVDEIPADAVER